MSVKQRLLCKNTGISALMAATSICIITLCTGMVALFSPYWIVHTVPSQHNITISEEPLSEEIRLLEVSYGLYLFCHSFDEWENIECFVSDNPNKDAPESLRPYFDSTTDDWYVVCRVLFVITVALCLLTSVLGLLALLGGSRAATFLAGTAGLLCLIAVILSGITVVLYRVKAYHDFDANNYRYDAESGERVSHFSWGWHFACVTSFLALLGCIIFNYAAIQERKAQNFAKIV